MRAYELLLLTAFASCPVAVGAQDWSRFLARPDSANASRLIPVASEGAPCSGRALPTNAEILRVERLIEQGNEWALQVALATTACLDGGNLEDVLRSAALAFDRDPERFLRVADRGGVSLASFRLLILMTPEALVDRLAEQATLLERRAERLSSASGHRFAAVVPDLHAAAARRQRQRP